MKRTIMTLLAILLLLSLSVLPTLASAHDGLCGCGREFATEDGDRYMIFDCLGCGRNYTSCTCGTCWCGDALTRTETEAGFLIVTCNGCSLPCEECICRDRAYYDALRDVEQGLTGEEIPNPDNGIVIVLAMVLPFALFGSAYFTVYRRRSATRARKNRAPALERDLDRIDKEPDPLKRYLLAKATEESKRDGDCRVLNREGKVLCHRKNELLAEAVEEDWVREAVTENLRHCRMMNDMGFVGSVETADRLWDDAKKDFSADRNEICGETPAQSLVKWDTAGDSIALFEIITPLNSERGSNLLNTASNTTRFGGMIFENKPLMRGKTDPESEAELRATLARIIPDGDIEHLLTLPEQIGEVRKAPANLPSEATAKRMGDKNRFPGGMAQ